MHGVAYMGSASLTIEAEFLGSHTSILSCSACVIRVAVTVIGMFSSCLYCTSMATLKLGENLLHVPNSSAW